MEKQKFLTHLILSLISIALYFKTNRTNPGYARFFINYSSNPALYQFKQSQILKQHETCQQNQTRQSKNYQQFNLPQKKYCQQCQIKQPYRTKHCKQCKQCILTFDHHCPWINNCIGEKNRHYLLLFSFIQSINGWITLINSILMLFENGDKTQISITIVTMIGIITLLISSLFGTHVYLMLNNITTWQIISWKKITYLNRRQRKNGSPFGIYYRQNIKQYWKIAFSNQLHDWHFPNFN